MKLAYQSRAMAVVALAIGSNMSVSCVGMPAHISAHACVCHDVRCRCISDGAEAPEVAATSWLMEGMLELRRQGFFRWGWAREDGVIQSLIAIGRFGEASEEEAKVVFSRAVTGQGRDLNLHQRDLAGLERQPQKINGTNVFYWRVRGVPGIVSRERLATLEAALGNRHRRTRLASVLNFHTNDNVDELQDEFFLQEFIKLDIPYYLEHHGDVLQVPTKHHLSERGRRHSARNNQTFVAITNNLIELLSSGIITVKGLDVSSLPETLDRLDTFSIPWAGAEEGLAEPEPEQEKIAAPMPVTPPKPKQVYSSYVVRDGRRKISPNDLVHRGAGANLREADADDGVAPPRRQVLRRRAQ